MRIITHQSQKLSEFRPENGDSNKNFFIYRRHNFLFCRNFSLLHTQHVSTILIRQSSGVQQDNISIRNLLVIENNMYFMETLLTL